MKIQASTFQSARQHSVKLNSKRKLVIRRPQSEFAESFRVLQKELQSVPRDIFQIDDSPLKGENTSFLTQAYAERLNKGLKEAEAIILYSEYNDPDAIETFHCILTLLTSHNDFKDQPIFAILSPNSYRPIAYRNDVEKLKTTAEKLNDLGINLQIGLLQDNGNLPKGFESALHASIDNSSEKKTLVLEADSPSPIPEFDNWLKSFVKQNPSCTIAAFDHHSTTSAAERQKMVEGGALSFLANSSAPSASLGTLEVFGRCGDVFDHTKMSSIAKILGMQKFYMATLSDVAFAGGLTGKYPLDKLSQRLCENQEYLEILKEICSLTNKYPFFKAFVGFGQKLFPFKIMGYGLTSEQYLYKHDKRVISPKDLALFYITETHKLTRADQFTVGVAAIYHAIQNSSNWYKENKLEDFAERAMRLDYTLLKDTEYCQLIENFNEELLREIKSAILHNPLDKIRKLTTLNLDPSNHPHLETLSELMDSNALTNNLFGGAIPARNIRQMLRTQLEKISNLGNYLVLLPKIRDKDQVERVHFTVLLKGEPQLMRTVADYLVKHSASEPTSLSVNGAGLGGGHFETYSQRTLLNALKGELNRMRLQTFVNKLAKNCISLFKIFAN